MSNSSLYNKHRGPRERQRMWPFNACPNCHSEKGQFLYLVLIIQKQVTREDGRFCVFVSLIVMCCSGNWIHAEMTHKCPNLL